MAFILSGAGGYEKKNNCEESLPMWSKGHVVGFMALEFTAD